MFTLENPKRLVVDMVDVGLATKLPSIKNSAGIIKNVRASVRNQSTTRFIVDVDEKAKFQYNLSRPNQFYNYRLILDFKIDRNSTVETKETDKNIFQVVIDPGHGGEDLGENYDKNIVEKDLSLQLAKKLDALINMQDGMKSLLTRDGDYHVGLATRLKIARRAKANLLVSIHTGKSDKRIGAMYVHRNKGASSDNTRTYAMLENQTDLIGGVNFENKDNLLTSVLLDMSSVATKEESIELASKLKISFDENEVLNFKELEFGGFKILLSPDVPSVLINVPYSAPSYSPDDIRSKKIQTKIVNIMLDGIKKYISKDRK